MKLYQPEEIRKWHKVFKRDGELFEIRLLGEKTQSGYFTDVEKAIQAIEPFDKTQLYQVYFTVNEVNPACSSRKQFNQFLMVKGSATSKNDISHRWWLPIDIDVQRPSDISSTDEEKEYAHKKAVDVYRFLEDNGFSTPIVCDSSSGYHLYYPIDLESTPESESIVHSLFDVLSARFTDDRVKIDKAVTDANRIMRLPGTWGRKGRDSEERPHRLARILTVPSEIKHIGKDFLQIFAEKYRIVEDKPVYRHGNMGEQFDLRKFIFDHGLKVRNETSWGNGGVKFVLEECPFDSSHKAPDSALFLSAQGAIGFKCFHDSCSHHDWHELRQMLDPTAYSGRDLPPVASFARRTYQPPAPEIKAETEEIGKKWLSLKDIDDVNIDSLPRISTGFRALDGLLGGGLFYAECTIISGINGSGKSSWLNTLILNAIQGGCNCALWTGELQSTRLKRWIIQAAAGERHVVESKMAEGKYYTPRSVSARITEWMDGKFLLYNNDYSANYAQLFHDMEEPVSLGYKLFILDNLFALDLDGLDGDENARQKRLILMIADFAKKNNVHVVLVAHPRKVVTFLRREDILGSSALQNAVDNIFIIHRVGTDFEKRGTELFGAKKISSLVNFGNVIEVCKNREFGSLDEFVGFHYDQKSRRFKEDQNDVRAYGWEDTPLQQSMTFNQEEQYMPFGMPTGYQGEDAPF